MWDSVLYQYHSTLDLPFTEANWQIMGNHSQELINNHTHANFSMALDPQVWALESHELGRIAYYGAVENQSLTMVYISENLPKL